MPAPGWYTDPDGSPRLRYFDGAQWTPHTAPHPTYPGATHPPGAAGPGYPQQGHGTGFQQHGGHTGVAPPAGGGRNNLWLWVALSVVVAMILGVGTWLVVRNPGTTVATPSASASVVPPSDPSPEPSMPSTDPTPPPSASPAAPPAELPQPGAIIDPITGCPATATDAVGQQNAEGRYASAGGFSMPAADGFVATPVQFPWLHGSNSQTKVYENNWMASFTVGEARAEDGFTETGATAVAMVACMLGSEFYASSNPAATVTGSVRAADVDGVKLTVDVAVSGSADVTTDAVHVLVVKDLGVMHVLIATVPDTDPAAAAALAAVTEDIRVG